MRLTLQRLLAAVRQFYSTSGTVRFVGLSIHNESIYWTKTYLINLKKYYKNTSRNGTKPLKQYEEAFQVYLQMFKMGSLGYPAGVPTIALLLAILATAYLRPAFYPPLLCCKTTWCHIYRITRAVPWFFRKISNRHVSIQRSVPVSTHVSCQMD
jgi:hypothetical protein